FRERDATPTLCFHRGLSAPFRGLRVSLQASVSRPISSTLCRRFTATGGPRQTLREATRSCRQLLGKVLPKVAVEVHSLDTPSGLFIGAVTAHGILKPLVHGLTGEARI